VVAAASGLDHAGDVRADGCLGGRGGCFGHGNSPFESGWRMPGAAEPLF
jgi:hypothetical protein